MKLSEIGKLAKIFKSNIESNMDDIPANSDLNFEKYSSQIQSQGIGTQKCFSQSEKYFGLIQNANQDDLYFILGLHLSDALNDDVDNQTYIKCAEIYSKLANDLGILQKFKDFLPKDCSQVEIKDVQLKSIAPNFITLLTM